MSLRRSDLTHRQGTGERVAGAAMEVAGFIAGGVASTLLAIDRGIQRRRERQATAPTRPVIAVVLANLTLINQVLHPTGPDAQTANTVVQLPSEITQPAAGNYSPPAEA